MVPDPLLIQAPKHRRWIQSEIDDEVVVGSSFLYCNDFDAKGVPRVVAVARRGFGELHQAVGSSSGLAVSLRFSSPQSRSCQGLLREYFGMQGGTQQPKMARLFFTWTPDCMSLGRRRLQVPRLLQSSGRRRSSSTTYVNCEQC